MVKIIQFLDLLSCELQLHDFSSPLIYSMFILVAGFPVTVDMFPDYMNDTVESCLTRVCFSSLLCRYEILMVLKITPFKHEMLTTLSDPIPLLTVNAVDADISANKKELLAVCCLTSIIGLQARYL